MPTKVKSGGLHGIATVAIYIFLVAALGTYFLPVVSVDLPVFGTKSWSVRDVVQTLPKSFAPKSGKGGERELSPNYDFLDMVKEVSSKRQAAKGGSGARGGMSISPTFILGALVPVALALAYLLTLLGLFLAPLKRGSAFIANSLLTAIFACYAYGGVFILNASAQRAFQESLAKVEDSPFSLIAKNLVQKVTIQPANGLIVLILLTLIVFGAGLYRRSRSAGY